MGRRDDWGRRQSGGIYVDQIVAASVILICCCGRKDWVWVSVREWRWTFICVGVGKLGWVVEEEDDT